MEYKLKLAAISGDIVPLHDVAMVMALRDATAGGTPYHAPTFKGRLPGHILALLEEVRSGRLAVCNAFGSPIAVDRSIDATEHFGYATRYVNEPDWEKLRREIPSVGDGVWDFSHIDFGPREIDKDSPNIAWFAKLKMLNEWAEKRGDSFVISHEGVGWIDERGPVVPTNQNKQDKKQDPVHPKSELKPTAAETATDTWKGSARKIGQEIAKRHKNFNLDQIAKKVNEEMLKRKSAGESGLTGRSDRVPSAGAIRRHALKGIKP